jgi:hypothetical protein
VHEGFKARFSWAAVESLLQAHFAQQMGYSGRAFDQRELLYIRERAKLGASDQVGFSGR